MGLFQQPAETLDREQVLFRLFGKYCPEGTILFAESMTGEELYVVQSGTVRLRRSGAPAGSGEVRGPGDILGEEAFFGRAPRRRRAEIIKDSRLLLVNDRTLDAVVRHGPEIAVIVTERLLNLAQDAQRGLEAWVLAHRLARAEPHLRGAGAGPLRPESLAESSGLSTPDAGSVLHELASRGALASAADGYRVADPAAFDRVVREIAAAGTEP